MLCAYPSFPPPLENISTDAEYAYMRARMAARKGGLCLEDYALRRALWLCFGLSEEGCSARVRKARLSEAVTAVLALGEGLSPAQRQSYFDARGDVMKCIANMLFLGINHKEMNGNGN
jgi:hypothetical protein